MTYKKEFVHLHVHSEYSMLDGAARIKPLLNAAKKNQMPAIAITDHGNMFGSFDFWKTAKDVGIKAIIGTEAYITPGTHRSERTRVRWAEEGNSDDVSGGGSYTHMTMLASSTTGMHNLFRLSSLSSLEGYYFKPRMDIELLQKYSEGIIATTGCPSGEVQTRIRLGQYDKALEAAANMRDIFGAENYFCEIMDHGIAIERRAMNDLHRLAKDLAIPLVATNDLHYVNSADAKSHAALLCVQSGSTLDDPKRFKFDSEEFYLKTAAEMRHLFRDYPEACDNTLLIAERCSSEFNTSANFMPRYPCPEGENEESWFIKEVEKGLHYRFPKQIPDEVRKQAQYETEVITKMGFAGYFLVVADFINWAKENGIRVGPGRGSGAGSMAAYAMRITDLDPLEHGLIFERFLNPDRVSMPDFDVDFDERRRGEVIKYVTQKYGDDRVAQIVTYGTIKAKQALKDSARVLGYPYGMGEKLTKAMPPAVMGKDIPLSDIENKEHERYKEATEFRDLVANDQDAKKVFETAKGIENLKRQWGVHAAGVIMSSEPLMNIIPIMKREQDGQIVTQFDYSSCESLGLIKMDFLGLRNLTILDDTITNIKINRQEDINLENLTLDDVKAYELIARGDTLGVFQLDGGPMRSLLKLMKPDNFEDISAVLALYRPGPMGANSHNNYALRKNNQQEITPIHPELAEPLSDILGNTYGLIVYQEQVMGIAQKLAGFTLAQADLLRRAMGKKKKSELDKQFETFKKGMNNNGYSDQAVKTLWEMLVPFTDYAFNKAHSAAYGVISYWTAYLKAHYPAEFMAALLTSVGDSKDKLALYLNECRKLGISVLAPDINQSFVQFTAVGDDIRFGLGAIRNVGANVVELIRETREKQGKYSSFHDFLSKVPVAVLNKRTVESLIKSGAFDALHNNRNALASIHEESVEGAAKKKKEESFGNVGFDFDSLFDEENIEVAFVPEIPEWNKKEKLAYERDMLGLYVSDHPLAGLELELAKHASLNVSDILVSENKLDNETVTIAGLITSVQHRTAKSGNLYASITLEDFTGEIQVMFMGKTYQEFASLLETDIIAVVKARVSTRDEGNSLHCYQFSVPNIESNNDNRVCKLTLRDRNATESLLLELKNVFIRNNGETPVELYLENDDSYRIFTVPHKVKITAEFFGDVKALLGPNALI